MLPEGDEDADGLTAEQFRWLVAVSVGMGVLVLVLVLGIAAASHVFGIGGGQDGPPDAGFSVRTVSTADGVAVEITHEGGEAANQEDVVITVDGDRVGNWSGLGGEGLGLVGPGHSLRLTEVEPGQDVRVYWIGDGVEERVLLGRNTVADPSDV